MKLPFNPYTASQFQKTMPTHDHVYPEVTADACSNVFAFGEKEYKEYVENRFIKGTAGVVKGVISRNALKLLKQS